MKLPLTEIIKIGGKQKKEDPRRPRIGFKWSVIHANYDFTSSEK